MQDNYEDYYKTSDLSLAATLVCVGFTVIRLEKDHDIKFIFLFDNSTDIKKAVESFWDNATKVNPKSYFAALKELKSRLWAEREAA